MLSFALGAAALAGLCLLTMVGPAEAAGEKPVVVIDTTFGPITVELDPDKAPITVANFLKYVDAKHYDGLIFHRVIPGFMVQGGGMDEAMQEKKVGPPIKNEAAQSGLSNTRGTIAMARTNDPDSATAQFYINQEDKNAGSLDAQRGSAGYAVFGKVIAGLETVDLIAKQPTGTKRGQSDVPVKPITIKSIARKAS